jgi:hypothetical protein
MRIVALALVGGLVGVYFNQLFGGFAFGAALGALAGCLTVLGVLVINLELPLLDALEIRPGGPPPRPTPGVRA